MTKNEDTPPRLRRSTRSTRGVPSQYLARNNVIESTHGAREPTTVENTAPAEPEAEQPETTSSQASQSSVPAKRSAPKAEGKSTTGGRRKRQALVTDNTTVCNICGEEKVSDPRDYKFSRWLDWRICLECYATYGSSRLRRWGFTPQYDKKVKERGKEIKLRNANQVLMDTRTLAAARARQASALMEQDEEPLPEPEQDVSMLGVREEGQHLPSTPPPSSVFEDYPQPFEFDDLFALQPPIPLPEPDPNGPSTLPESPRLWGWTMDMPDFGDMEVRAAELRHQILEENEMTFEEQCRELGIEMEIPLEQEADVEVRRNLLAEWTTSDLIDLVAWERDHGDGDESAMGMDVDPTAQDPTGQ